MKQPRQEHHSPRRYDVRHVTTYTYADDVTASYGRACLRPRDTIGQSVLTHSITVDPVPAIVTEGLDLFGNWTHYLEIHTPHRRLEVTKSATIDVARLPWDLSELDRWTVAEAVAAPPRPDADPALRAAFLLPSPLVTWDEEVRAYGAALLPPAAPLGEALAGLVTAIFEGFTYAKGATNVRTTLPELLRIRAGVCQDFAHLMIGVLRSMGLPARYVSGYLETAPPPGKPKLQGADATHAWAGVQLPDGRWLDLDPTNDCVADSRYLVTAWGRDYRDVAPLKGVIYTEGASSTLTVAVDVTRVGDDIRGDVGDSPRDQAETGSEGQGG